VAGSATGADGLEHWIVRRGTAAGTWATIDDWQPIAGRAARANAPIVLSRDERLVVGTAQGEGATLAYQWRARRSPDGGGSWEDADVFQLQSGLWAEAQAAAFADATPWAAGWSQRGNLSIQWHVRRSAAGGALGTWTDADTFQLSAGESSIAYAIALAGDDAWAAGLGTAAAVSRWIVRASLGGAAWATVDDLQGGLARDVHVASDGAVYVAGAVPTWTIRRTIDGGRSWQTLDIFQLEVGQSSEARAIFVDDRGAIAVLGWAGDARGRTHTIVRTSEDDGASWQTIDDYLYLEEHSAVPRSFVQDQEGDVDVALAAVAEDTQLRWVVRRATCR
jgi:hypothetical protein